MDSVTQAEALTDVQQAAAVGFDALALNVQDTTDTWATDAVQYLFEAAATTDMQLFFSFDMSVLTSPSQFLPMLEQWITNDTYYTYNDLPFVSTFYGGTLTFGASSSNAGWEEYYTDALSALGIETYFVPAFSDSPDTPSEFFEDFTVVDGMMCWDCAWPATSDTPVNVSSTVDAEYLEAGHAANKTYMMGMFSLPPTAVLLHFSHGILPLLIIYHSTFIPPIQTP